jgi:hypothetical protein
MRESYLMIDNRVSGGSLFEAPTYTCRHCQAVVVMNPGRTRERGYCRKCDGSICDNCVGIMHATLTCVPIDKVFDTLQEEAIRGQARL